MGIWQKRLLSGAGIAMAFVLLAFLYADASRYYPLDSDTSNALLEGRDVLRGNPLLSHWHLTTVSYYTTDVLFFALALLFLPFKPSTLHNVYALIYAATVITSVWLAGRRNRARRLDRTGMTAAFAVLAFPSPAQGASTFLGPLHVGMMFWIIPALLALDYSAGDHAEETASGEQPVSLPWVRLFVALICLALALIGDTMALYVALLPIAAVSLLRLRRGQGDRGNEWAILGMCLGAEILAKLFSLLVRLCHEYQISSYAGNDNARFVDFALLGANVRYSLQGMLQVFNADFFGLPIGQRAIIPLSAFVGLCLILYSAWRLLAALKRSQAMDQPQPPVDRIAAVVALGMAANLFCYGLSNLVVGVETLRYLVPLVLYAGVLTGRYGIVLWKECADRTVRREIAAAFTLASISWLLVFAVRAVRQPLPGPSPAAQLGKWLGAHNLSYGYGTYWAGTVVTVESQGAVRVCPIIGDGGRITPMLWAADERWYRGHPANFLVLENPTFGGVDVKTAEANFGPEAERYSVAGYTVLVWNKDITPLLANY